MSEKASATAKSEVKSENSAYYSRSSFISIHTFTFWNQATDYQGIIRLER
jgi:hypothetical protein